MTSKSPSVLTPSHGTQETRAKILQGRVNWLASHPPLFWRSKKEMKKIYCIYIYVHVVNIMADIQANTVDRYSTLYLIVNFIASINNYYLVLHVYMQQQFSIWVPNFILQHFGCMSVTTPLKYPGSALRKSEEHNFVFLIIFFSF